MTFQKKNDVTWIVLSIVCFSSLSALAQSYSYDKADWEGGIPDGCTTITVGKLATADGSVITSHTCDSHRTRGWLTIAAPATYEKESELTLVKRVENDSLAMPSYKYIATGKIPQVESTYGFINTAYPCMNDQQLAIGESTFGGRETLQSEKGLIDCQQLVRLMMDRCRTARQAIKLAGILKLSARAKIRLVRSGSLSVYPMAIYL